MSSSNPPVHRYITSDNHVIAFARDTVFELAQLGCRRPQGRQEVVHSGQTLEVVTTIHGTFLCNLSNV